MAKTFTETKSLPFEQVKIKNLTENRDGVIEQFNGNLSSENIYSINIDRLEDPKNITSTAGNVTKRIVSQPTQTYALVSRDYRNSNTDSSDIWEPIDSLNPETDVFQKGFNTLQGLFGSARYQDFPLTFDCEEGMLTGMVTVDWEHGTQQYNATASTEPALSLAQSRGMGWWTEWGVFVNGILIARSGFIYPRRHTTRIPFSVPVGSQSVTIDCRVVINSWEETGFPGNGKSQSDFNFYSGTIMARNIKR